MATRKPMTDLNMQRITGLQDCTITIWNIDSMKKRKVTSQQNYATLCQVIDELGEASAKAQGLSQFRANTMDFKMTSMPSKGCFLKEAWLLRHSIISYLGQFDPLHNWAMW
jgi:hypothetical protein